MKKLILAALAALTMMSTAPALAMDAGPDEPAAVETPAEVEQTGIELPAPSDAEPKDVGEAVGTVAEAFCAFRSREFAAGFFSVLALLAFVLRRLAEWKTRWFEASVWRVRGLMFAVAFLYELLTAWAAEQAFSWGMLAVALGLALGAAGVWHNRPAARHTTGFISGPLR